MNPKGASNRSLLYCPDFRAFFMNGGKRDDEGKKETGFSCDGVSYPDGSGRKR